MHAVLIALWPVSKLHGLLVEFPGFGRHAVMRGALLRLRLVIRMRNTSLPGRTGKQRKGPDALRTPLKRPCDE